MGKGRAGSRKNRVYIFREWLIQTYGSYLSREMATKDATEDNNHGSNASISMNHRKRKRAGSEPPIVLDVAGGKGDLSWLLKNVDGIESVVVDPWKPDPKTVTRNERMVKSIEYLRQNPEEAQKRSVPCLPTYQPLAALLPRLLENRSERLRNKKKTQNLDDSKTENLSSISSSVSNETEESESAGKETFRSNTDGPCHPNDFLTPRILHVPLDEALVQRVRDKISEDTKLSKSQTHTDKATKMVETESKNSTNLNTNDEDDILDLLTSGRIKLIVGFHPDQATEPCVDLARLLDIPYCVVPCCVFPSEFPDRRVMEDKLVPVRTYQQFLEYLKAKATSPIPGSSISQSNHGPIEMHTAHLDFPFTETAKNIVLYSLPS